MTAKYCAICGASLKRPWMIEVRRHRFVVCGHCATTTPNVSVGYALRGSSKGRSE